MSVLVIAESDGKTIDRSVLSCVTAAIKISSEVDILVLYEIWMVSEKGDFDKMIVFFLIF